MSAERATFRSRRPFHFALLLGLAHAITFALAFPPFNLWPLVFVTLIPLLMVAGVKRAPLAVWLACLPAFGFHHWWLKDVTLVGTPLLVMYMSLWPAVYVWVVGWAFARVGAIGALIFPCMLWIALEFTRGELFAQGYPWFLLGQPMIDFGFGSKFGSIDNGIDPYRMGLIVAILNLLLVVIVAPNPKQKRRAQDVVFGLVAFVFLLGLNVRYLASPIRPDSPPLRVAVLQTNIPQSNKQFGTVAQRVADFQRFLEQSYDAAQQDPKPDLIVWPETMVPVVWGLNDSSYFAERNDAISIPIETAEGTRRLPTTFFRDELIKLQSMIDVPMLVGATAAEGLTFTNTTDGGIDIDFDARFNSAFLIRNGIVEETRYDKITLTPFGEVMPYISAWPWLERQLLALGANGMAFDLKSGTERTVFEVQNDTGEIFRIVTPICFEITYAGACRDLVFEGGERRADAMVNLTNDGWFGGWDPGREMHQDAARWRAAELATPVVRAANTGYSCLIDDSGRVVSRLGANEEGVLVVEVEKGDGSTLFGRIGFLIPWMATGGSVILLVYAGIRGTKASENTQDTDGSNADDS